MLFTSGYFFLLVFVTMVLYYGVARRDWQIGLLLVSSFVFYAWEFPVLLALLLVSIAINVATARGVLRSGDDRRRKAIAALGVVVNLAVLAFFKYSPLIGRTFFPEASEIGRLLVSVPLPIGISFFTFQGISLLVDLFRGDVFGGAGPQVRGEVEERGEDPGRRRSLRDTASGGGTRGGLPGHQRSLRDTSASGVTRVGPSGSGEERGGVAGLALYIAFFPQLVAGPIVKAKDFLPQLGVKRWADIAWPVVFQALVTGYFLKMVVADNLKDFTAYMVYPGYESIPRVDLLVLLLGYSMQIFADFAGYSLIAIGVARLFGYRLMDNFRFPYIAASFSEFWRRWHISLSTFLKEYLYIPLGGNRGGSFFTYRNLMITMALGGLWHGAAWSYAVWGIYHGLLLAGERFCKDRNWVWTRRAWPRRLWVFALVTAGWLLFRLPDFDQVLGFLNGLLTNRWYAGLSRIPIVMLYCLPVVLYHLAHLYLPKESDAFRRWGRPIGLGVMLFLILTNAGTAGEFIYFQF